jgi:HSP20 family molecular chaperone IbpA
VKPIPEGAMMNINLLKSTEEPEKGSQSVRKRIITETMSWQIRTHSHVWSPPTDLFETDTSFVVRVEIAGMRDQDFSVTIENNFLVISGNRKDNSERRAFHQLEIRFGEFSTMVALPGPVDSDSGVVEYADGFLVVTLTKKVKN